LGTSNRRASFKPREIEGGAVDYDAEIGANRPEEKVKAEADHFADTGRHQLAQRCYEQLRAIHNGDPQWQDWIDRRVSQIGMLKQAWDARRQIEEGLHNMANDLRRKIGND
jgi:hypothetical protein